MLTIGHLQQSMQAHAMHYSVKWVNKRVCVRFSLNN